MLKCSFQIEENEISLPLLQTGFARSRSKGCRQYDFRCSPVIQCIHSVPVCVIQVLARVVIKWSPLWPKRTTMGGTAPIEGPMWPKPSTMARAVTTEVRFIVNMHIRVKKFHSADVCGGLEVHQTNTPCLVSLLTSGRSPGIPERPFAAD